LYLPGISPPDDDYTGAIICRADDVCDGLTTTCTPIYESDAVTTTWSDTNVVFGQTYCYKLFPVDEQDNVGSGITDSGSPIDTTPPEIISQSYTDESVFSPTDELVFEFSEPMEPSSLTLGGTLIINSPPNYAVAWSDNILN
jgi:hypothetical protein